MEERMLRLLHRAPGARQDIAAAIARALQPGTGQHEAAVMSGQEATLSPRFIDLWISQASPQCPCGASPLDHERRLLHAEAA